MTQELGFNKLLLASAGAVHQILKHGTLLFLFLNLCKRSLKLHLLCLCQTPAFHIFNNDFEYNFVSTA